MYRPLRRISVTHPYVTIQIRVSTLSNMHENPNWIIVSQEAAANIGYQALIPAVILTALALVTVALRWYSRAKVSGTYGIEDVAVTLALVSLPVRYLAL